MSPRPNQRHADRHEHGLTLIELVVVLTILAALSAIAITSTSGLTDRARFESTQRTIESLHEAVLGRDARFGEDPTSVPTGFVADVGRLPTAKGPDGLRELMVRGILPTYEPRSPVGDTTLRILSGWRGPYLRLPAGAREIKDGWGREFLLFDIDDKEITDELPVSIGAVKCYGSDGADNTNGGDAGYERDFERDCVFKSPNSDHATGALVVQVVVGTNVIPHAAVVRVYGPSEGIPVTLGHALVDPARSFDRIEDESTNGFGITAFVTFDDLPVGPKWVRAYASKETDPNAPLNITRIRSIPRHVTVLAGGTELPTPLYVGVDTSDRPEQP